MAGVSKRFGDHRVLDRLDLTVAPGESVVVIGRSGAGKSVLFKCLLGLMKPDAGEIWLDEERMDTLPPSEQLERMRRFGMLFQGGALFDSMTVGENVGFELTEHMHWSKAKVRERVDEVLGWVGLPGVAARKPAQLSGGMQKRVALARAIAASPDIILYDEPTTGLDPIMADVINRLIRDINRRLGATSVTITHDMNSAYFIADRIAMLHEGAIHAQGTPDEIRASTHPLVRQFIEGRAEGPIQV